MTTNTIGVSGAPVSQDFYGLCTGDWNRTHIPPTGSKSIEGEGSIRLTYNETVKVLAGSEFDLPVFAGSDMEVGAITLIMNFPQDLISIEGVYLQDGSAGSQVGSLAFNVISDQLRIAWFNDTPLNFAKGDPMLVIRMRVSLAFGQGDQIKFTLDPDPINELGDGSYETIENALVTMNVAEAGTIGIIEQDMRGLTFSNHPNPFSDYTFIEYYLPVEGNVRIVSDEYAGE
ncbi:MAG: hypothetical protein MZV63_56185 [Marinilabiliales bacterium]|nr:hypothetical protein [Marinilabiliales bacterium]